VRAANLVEAGDVLPHEVFGWESLRDVVRARTDLKLGADRRAVPAVDDLAIPNDDRAIHAVGSDVILQSGDLIGRHGVVFEADRRLCATCGQSYAGCS
jgi:hypothetical protein